MLNVVATAPDGATAHAQRTVVWDFVPGTVLLDVTDPDDDDNGPGNYAYPTSDNFQPGAYDLQRFQVIDAGDDIVFRVQTRDLTPTFGSPLGAQLVDVYVHDPGAATTSTAASFATRNYAIAPDAAWSRLIEVQGFGQRYIDATGTTLGTVAISANAISRFITFSVPKASLGTPTSGWGFTVVLTGQDGFSSDQARGFQTTPQDFQFGVCATASSDPHCTVDPSTVPKAMDVITPAGVAQSTELDYTLGAGGAPGRDHPVSDASERTALVFGASNLGRAVLEHLVEKGWNVAGAARSDATLEGVASLGGLALRSDITDPDERHRRAAADGRALRAGRPGGQRRGGLRRHAQRPVRRRADRRGRPDRVRRLGRRARARGVHLPLGGGPLRPSPGRPDDARAGDRRLGPAGDARPRAVGRRRLRRAGHHPGRGPGAARRGDPRRAADRRRGDRAVLGPAPGQERDSTADPHELAHAVAFLAEQGARAATHELQVTPLGERWVP